MSRPQTAEHSNFSSVTTPRYSRVSINFESIGLATEGHTGTGEMCSNGQMGSSCSINRIVEVKGRGRKRNKLKKTLNFFFRLEHGGGRPPSNRPATIYGRLNKI